MPAVSKSQRRLMGMAEAVKKGELPADKYPGAAKVAKSMSLSDLSHYATTKEGGLPERKKKG